MLDDVGSYEFDIPAFWKPGTQPELAVSNTPHIKELTESGTLFTRYYTYAVCSPARAAAMTGLHAADPRNGVYSNGKHPGDTENFLFQYYGKTVPLTSLTNTTGRLLRKLNYTTAHINKIHGFNRTHFRSSDLFDRIIELPGTDYQYYDTTNYTGELADKYYAPYTEAEVDYIAAHQDRYNQTELRNILVGTPKHKTDAYEALMEDVVTEMREDSPNKPFYVQWHMRAPHMPAIPRTDLIPFYESGGKNQVLALLETADQAIGRFISFLDREGLRNDTLILLTADNGSKREQPRDVAKGRKGGSYQNAVNVPLVVSLPGVIPAGQSKTHPVHVTDLLPTWLEIAGMPKSEVDQMKLGGRSFASVLECDVSVCPVRYRNIYSHLPQLQRNGPFSSIVGTTGRWKLSYRYLYDIFELYDLKKDPAETENLLVERGDKALARCVQLRDWLNETTSQDTDYIIDRATNLTVPFPSSCTNMRSFADLQLLDSVSLEQEPNDDVTVSWTLTELESPVNTNDEYTIEAIEVPAYGLLDVKMREAPLGGNWSVWESLYSQLPYTGSVTVTGLEFNITYQFKVRLRMMEEKMKWVKSSTFLLS